MSIIASFSIFSQRTHIPTGPSVEAILVPQIPHVSFMFVPPSVTRCRQAQLTARLSLPDDPRPSSLAPPKHALALGIETSAGRHRGEMARRNLCA
jgi:hypothetical protein